MAAIATHHITVSDMKCNGCENTIEHELRHETGVERVSANHIEGTVEIEGAEDLDLDRLVETIDDLGFSATA
jgi:copper chaperone CopZ